MGKTVSAIVIIMLVFALVWTGTVLYWYVSDTSPGGWQVALWLLVLPVALLAAIWAFMHRRVRAESPEQDRASEVKVSDTDVARPLRLDIPAVALRLPSGETPGEVLGGIISPPTAPFHPYLRDAEGLPLFSAPVTSLDDQILDDIAAELSRLAGHRLVVDQGTCRALALLFPVLDELLAALVATLPAATAADEKVIAGLRHRSAPQRAPVVAVTLWLPASCPEAIRPLCEAMMRERVSGQSGLPKLVWRFQCRADGGAGEVWRMFPRAVDRQQADEPWQLLLAADSLLDERRLQTLLAAGGLMTSRHPEGRLPGEGAAGVLIRPGSGDKDTLYCLGPAQTSVGHVKSSSARARLISDIARRDNGPASGESAPTLLISDADYRTGKTEEAALVGLALAPELDTATQIVALGRGGDLGVTAPLVMLILAWQALRSGEECVLLLGLEGDGERVVAAITTTPPEQNQGEPPGAAAVESE